jgi:hypothetical protein
MSIGLGPVAAFVLSSLHDHPDLRIPDAIVAETRASGTDSEQSFDVQAVKDGLAELESKGLAEKESARGWRLTAAGLGEAERLRSPHA